MAPINKAVEVISGCRLEHRTNSHIKENLFLHGWNSYGILGNASVIRPFIRHRYVSIEIITTAMVIVDGTLSDCTRVIRLRRSSFDGILDQYYRGRNTILNLVHT